MIDSWITTVWYRYDGTCNLGCARDFWITSYAGPQPVPTNQSIISIENVEYNETTKFLTVEFTRPLASNDSQFLVCSIRCYNVIPSKS